MLGIWFRWLESIEEIEVNLFEQAKQKRLIKTPRKRKKVVKTIEMVVIQRMITTADEKAAQGDVFAIRDKAMMLILINCGLRNEEVRDIKISDVSFNKQELFIRGKGQAERVVPFSASVASSIKQWLKIRPKTEVKNLFTSFKPSKTGIHGRLTGNALGEVIKKWQKKAGIDSKIDVTPHSWRRTFATEYIRNGGNLPHLQKLMGHSNITTTAIYINIHIDDLHKNKGFAPDVVL